MHNTRHPALCGLIGPATGSCQASVLYMVCGWMNQSWLVTQP